MIAQVKKLEPTVYQIEKLKNIFLDQNWLSEDEFNKFDTLHTPQAKCFEDFCLMLSEISIDQGELILKLSEDFMWLDIDDYAPLLKTAISNIDIRLVNNANEIFILPLSTKNKISSGSSLIYIYRRQIRTFFDHKGDNVRFIDTPDKLDKLYSGRKNSLVILLDDFMGSGISANTAVDNFYKVCAGNTDCLIVLTLVSLELGMSRLATMGIIHYTAEILRKGITDNDNINNKIKALEIMAGIESRIKITRKYKLGFERSEALISLVNTPNNTFPVFWWPNKVNSKLWPAPFPREFSK